MQSWTAYFFHMIATIAANVWKKVQWSQQSYGSHSPVTVQSKRLMNWKPVNTTIAQLSFFAAIHNNNIYFEAIMWKLGLFLIINPAQTLTKTCSNCLYSVAVVFIQVLGKKLVSTNYTYILNLAYRKKSISFLSWTVHSRIFPPRTNSLMSKKKKLLTSRRWDFLCSLKFLTRRDIQGGG